MSLPALIALLSLTAAAQTDPVDALEARLLGGEPTEVPTVAAPMPPPPPVPLWPLVLGGVGLVVLYGLRQKAYGTIANSEAPIVVLSRMAIDGRSGVALIEAVDADGRHRRLLIGTGSGPPQLIAELGGRVEDFEKAYDAAEAKEGESADQLIDAILAGAGGAS